MRNLFLIISLVFLSCHSRPVIQNNIPHDTPIVHIHPLLPVSIVIVDTKCDSLIKIADSINSKLFLVKSRVNQIKEYVKTPKKIELSTVEKIIDSVYIFKGSKISFSCDNVKNKLDSLRKEIFFANYRMEQSKFYVKICKRKNSQIVFLKGWLRRAVR